jgi:hypothetical protein
MLIAASAMMTSASIAVMSLVRSGVRADSCFSGSQALGRAIVICGSSPALLDKT